MTSPKASQLLIVDDDDDLRKAIAFDFERKGYPVSSARGGNEAFDIISEGSIDVVITDIRMPNGDGITLLERIKSFRVDLPVVIFVTGFTDLSLEEAFDSGAEAVFPKPYDRKALFEAVRKATTPRQERWRLNPDDPKPETRITLDLAEKNPHFGRGGIFLPLGEPLPAPKTRVELDLRTTQGTGIVRWARKQLRPDLPSGCGIEFTSLDETCRSQIIQLIEAGSLKSYIPKR